MLFQERQELLRHGSTRVTMDIDSQAQMPAKRAARQKVVAMVRTPVQRATSETGTSVLPKMLRKKSARNELSA